MNVFLYVVMYGLFFSWMNFLLCRISLSLIIYNNGSNYRLYMKRPQVRKKEKKIVFLSHCIKEL